VVFQQVFWCQLRTSKTATSSAPCQKPVSINLQKWFLSPTGRLNFGFTTKGKITAMLITPSSWDSQLVRQHRTIKAQSIHHEIVTLSQRGYHHACP
jgi:hypothetical protein